MSFRPLFCEYPIHSLVVNQNFCLSAVSSLKILNFQLRLGALPLTDKARAALATVLILHSLDSIHLCTP
jgi:hypothetical protein